MSLTLRSAAEAGGSLEFDVSCVYIISSGTVSEQGPVSEWP